MDGSSERCTIPSFRKRYVIPILAMLAVMIIGVCGVVTYWVIEQTKDTEFIGGTMMGKDGKIIATDYVKAYSTLFDLPRFDIKTLSHVTRLTIQLDGNIEVSFLITGVVKNKQRMTATFLTASGNKIIVDSSQMLAMTELDGRTYVTGSTLRTGNRTGGGSLSPRMHNEDAFFTASNGFLGRRLQDNSEHGGWAEVGIAAAQAFLQQANEATGGEQHTSILIRDAVLTCTAKGAKSSQSGLMSVFYDATDARLTKVKTDVDGEIQFYDFMAHIIFTSNLDGIVTRCDDKPNGLPSSDLGELVRFGSEEGVLHAMPQGADGLQCILFASDYELGANSSSLMGPVSEDCHAVDEETEDTSRRLVERGSSQFSMRSYRDMIQHLAGTHETRRLAQSHWQLASDSYRRCTQAYNGACVLQDGCRFAFRGTDDLSDWVSNVLGVVATRSVQGAATTFDRSNGELKSTHIGFAYEFYKLKSFLDSQVVKCPDPQWIGHSLGGAIATFARQWYGKGSVHTFGAPPLFENNNGCFTNSNGGGFRLYHEWDPLAGYMAGAMAGFWHAQKGTEIQMTCRRYSWWGRCTQYGAHLAEVGCTQGSGWWDFAFGASYHNLHGLYKIAAV